MNKKLETGTNNKVFLKMKLRIYQVISFAYSFIGEKTECVILSSI